MSCSRTLWQVVKGHYSFFWSLQWRTVDSSKHPMWQACSHWTHNDPCFCNSLIWAAFLAVSLANCLFLTVLTLWKAKDTQVQQFVGQPRHGKPINKTKGAIHGGDMSHPWSVPFFKQPLFLFPVNSQTMTNQLTCIISLRGSSFKWNHKAEL